MKLKEAENLAQLGQTIKQFNGWLAKDWTQDLCLDIDHNDFKS